LPKESGERLLKRFNYILKRVLQMIPVLFCVTIVVFLMIHLIPGDPARTMLGERATNAQVAALREKLGLDKSLIVQYGIFMGDLFRGDLGMSILNKKPVLTLLGERLSLTVWLTLMASAFCLLFTIPLGYIAAVKRNRWQDQVIRGGTLVALSVPVFWVGMLLLMAFALRVRIFPIGGWGNDTWQHFRGLVLPAFALSLSVSAVMIRNLRNNIVDVSRSDYVDFARSKGLPGGVVRSRYIVRNALIAPVTLLAMEIAYMLGGSAITETVFNLNGIGRLMVQSIFGRDYPVVQGSVLVIALLVLTVNLLTDILYTVLDPRVTLE
jgi:peptide/nickel transport system permease protein